MSAISRAKPLLAFTSGDPAGIGPETVVRALAALRGACRPLLVGEAAVWRRAGWRGPVLDTGLGLLPAHGRPTAKSGRAAFAALELGARLASRGLVDGLVTAPISKEAWAMAGVPFRDHTGYLSKTSGREAEMILGVPSRKLWCVLATRHIPLMSVGKALSPARISAAKGALRSALKKLGLKSPRLAVCALNPHAGEGGLLGRDVPGALPADSAWRLHVEGELDGLVCLYHDQALIPLKTAGGLSGVNWSAGLPFIRTSPAHGTGFDIAGKRRADPSATIEAAKLAATLAWG